MEKKPQNQEKVKEIHTENNFDREQKTAQYFKKIHASEPLVAQTNLPAIEKPTLLQAIQSKMTKIELIKNFANITLHSTVENNYPSVAELSKTHGEKIIHAVLGVMVQDLNQSFSMELEKNQEEEVLAELMYSVFSNLSIEAVYISIRELKWMDIYGKLTVNKILKHLMSNLYKIIEAKDEQAYMQHLSRKEKRTKQQEIDEYERFKLKRELNLSENNEHIRN